MSESKEFLKKFFGGTKFKIELRTIVSSGGIKDRIFSRDTDELARFIDEQLAKGANVYFGCATRDGIKHKRTGTVGGKVNCREVVALWCDVDVKDVAQSQVLERICAFSPAPSIIISSGGGFHPYWLLAAPVDAQDERIEPALRRLAVALDADPACAEIARVLRPPGTRNFKLTYGQPQDVMLLRADWERRYTLDDFKNGDGAARPPADNPLGLKIPDGVDFERALALRLKFDRRIEGDKIFYCYHNIAGQPCLIQGTVHAEQARNVRQCAFVVEAGHVCHMCFDSDCRGETDTLARGLGFENVGPTDLPSKVRRALMLLDERSPNLPSLLDLLMGEAPKTQAAAETLETVLVIEPFSTIVAKPMLWLWSERIPAAKLTIFSGNPDEGKTTAFCDVAARYTTGRDWPDGAKNTLPPGDVLILNAEDDPADTLKPRLMAAGADLARVHYLRCVRASQGAKKRDRMLALDTDLGALERALVANPNIRLVGIDPVTGYLGKADMNREQELRRVLTPIAELAERSGVTFVALGHFNKRSDVRAIHRVGGAVAMSGVARSVLLFMRDPKAVEQNQYLMLLGKGNLTRKRTGLKYGFAEKKVELPDGSATGVPIIDWRGEATDDAETVLEIAADSKGKSAARAEQFLEEHLAGKGERASDWIEAEAKKRHVSRYALFNAKKEKAVRAFRKNGQWWWIWDTSKGTKT